MLLASLTCGSLFLLSFILVTNAINMHHVANRWLGIFFLFAGFAILSFLAERYSFHLQYPLLIPALETTRFAMAPALYLATLHFTNTTTTPSWKNSIHFIPALIFILLLAGLSKFLPHWAGLIVVIGLKLQLILYWIAGYRLILSSRQTALHWLKLLMITAGIMTAVYLLSPHIRLLTNYHIIFYFACANIAAYYVIRQRIIPSLIHSPRLTEKALHGYRLRLETLMTEEEPFTNPDLSLPTLASQLNISVHELSYLLNTGLEKNFYQYINQFRVAKAQQLLSADSHQHLSILAIGFEAGFNSKTAFNTAFKKLTGQTPGEFRKVVVRLDTNGH